MASLVEITDALRSLQDMFKDLDGAVVRKVYTDYKDHPNQFDAAVTELLTIHAVKEQEAQQGDKTEDSGAEHSADAPNPAAFEQVGSVFPDLSRSVIGGALFQNQGQVAGAIELLINIGQDKDAMAQIRDMNPEKKAEYANDRAKEREAVLREREAKLEAERLQAQRAAEAERAAAESERIRQEEAKKAKEASRLEFVRMMEAKLAADLANHKAQENARAFSEAERLAEAERNAGTKNEQNNRLAELQEVKERDAALAREAQSQLLARLKAQQERLGMPELDLERSIAHLKGEAERYIIEQKRYEDDALAGAARLAEYETRMRQQAEQLEALRREREMQRSCSLSAEYSQKDKRLLVSWVLGADRQPTSYDWVGVFSVNSTNPKQYHTYISTESTAASTHECPLPTEPGLYVCIYFHGKAQEVMASSDQIYLGPSLEMIATADPIRRVITMRYEVKTGNPTTKDWIGFYRSDKTDRQYIEYKWLQPDRLSGVWEVKMPRRGGYDYEFRFFSHTLRQPMQTSNKVKLAKEDYLSIKSNDVLELHSMVRDEVSWTIVSVDPSNWDWIELVSVPDNKRVTWNYIDSNAMQATFNRPRTPGTYRYRYWARSIGSGPVAQSPTFEVVNRDKITVADIDGVLQATHDVLSVDNNTSCWVGLYPEDSDKYITFQYIANPADNNRTLKFTKPAPGRYDVRFFSSADKHKPVIKSEAFVVQ